MHVLASLMIALSCDINKKPRFAAGLHGEENGFSSRAQVNRDSFVWKLKSSAVIPFRQASPPTTASFRDAYRDIQRGCILSEFRR